MTTSAPAPALKEIRIIPLPGFPEVTTGDDLPAMILAALRRQRLALLEGDVIVVKQKAVSKAEGRVVKLAEVVPGKKAVALARRHGKDPRVVELVLRESVRVVREGHGVIITETRQGFVCANSGVDRSNVPDGQASLLPADPDASAKQIRESLEKSTKTELGVIVTDTFGRPWRKGQTDVAIGCSGINPLNSYRGKKDRHGYELRVTEPSLADEIAGAAELASGKLTGVPVVLVRGVRFSRGEGGVRSMLMDRDRDLFR